MGVAHCTWGLLASAVYIPVHAGVNELKLCRAKLQFLVEAALIGGCIITMGAFIDRVGYGRYSSSELSCLFLP